MSVNKNSQGSIVIAALIITLITGTLVGLFLRTVTQEVNNTYRYRMGLVAVNLAEAGVEYAMEAMINDDWSNWTKRTSGNQERLYRDNFPYVHYSSHNESRRAKVYVQIEDGHPAIAIAEGSVTHRNGIHVSRQIMVELRSGASEDPRRGGFFANGITAKKSLVFNGNGQQMDSFSSSINPNGRTNISDIYNDQVITTILGHSLAGGNCSVASTSVQVSDISVGNADVFGSLATGAGPDVDISTVVGPNGSVYNANTQLGDESFMGGIDYNYIGYEFDAQFPDPTTPTLQSPRTSPESGKKGAKELGESGKATEYQLSGISIGGTKNWPVKGDVVLVIDGDLQITGKGSMELEPDATLEMYVSGEVKIAGNGLLNAGKPENVIIYSTGNSDVHLGGNGKLSAAVYAPNSFVHLGGGGNSGEMFGAIVGEDVKLNGHFGFHYDEDLSEFGVDENPDPGEDMVPEVSHWAELAGAYSDAEDPVDISSLLESGFSLDN